MTIWLFIIGALTALGCGMRVADVGSTAQVTLICTLAGFGGAGLMLLAIALRKWGF